jgi:predicted P-loop ATPase
MAPILVGPQGALKTSAVKAMSPAVDFYSSIKLHDKDADTSRKMRGRLVVELEELRGINSRAIEEIKAFITHTHEEWVPKFKEFRTLFARRCLLIGTTNDDEFLADPTGERRWLPGWTDLTDPEWIAEHRDQLWAEGAARFMLDGVDWLEAEKLARGEHDQFKVEDPWTPFVQRWLHDDAAMAGGRPMDHPHITVVDALTGAINMRPDAITHAIRMRMGKVLTSRSIGYTRHRQRVGGEPMNIYVKG